VGFEQIVPPESLRNLHTPPQAHRWLAHFDASFYRLPDDGAEWEDLRALSDAELYEHFLRYGHATGRPYNRFFRMFLDPNEYRRLYPDLMLDDTRSAVRDWMYEGVFERRIPNRQTLDMINAKVHVFQMGKVGSQSIDRSLRDAGFESFVPNFHWAGDIVTTYPQCFYPYDEIVNWDPDRELLFISGVRHPLERLVSGLFQQTLDARNDSRSSDIIDMLQGPVAQVESALQPSLEWILDWFSHRFFRGIDVYDHPFDVEQGYSIVRQGPVTVFLYRYDALDRCWEPLSELVGRRLRPVFENVSEFKSYADDYRRALEIVQGTEFNGLQEQIRASRLWRHFMEAGIAHRPATSTGGPADAPFRDAASAGSPTASQWRPSEPLASWSAPQLPRGWVRLDAMIRGNPGVPPKCALSITKALGRGRTAEQRVQITPDASGAMRLYMRLPQRCVDVALGPDRPEHRATAERATLREISRPRVLVEVLWWHLRHDPFGLLQTVLRVLRTARSGGTRGIARRFLLELCRNVPGFGFRVEVGPAAVEAPGS
jgi:hypothetical protein